MVFGEEELSRPHFWTNMRTADLHRSKAMYSFDQAASRVGLSYWAEEAGPSEFRLVASAKDERKLLAAIAASDGEVHRRDLY